MKKTILLVCLMLLCGCMLLACSGDDGAKVTTEEGLVLERRDGSYMVTDYTGNATELTIPATYNETAITRIGDFAFEKNEKLTKITLPEGLTTIGTRAFYCCTELTELTLPNTVTQMGNSVFSGCKKLGKLTLPTALTAIPENAFRDCVALTSIAVPDTVTTIQKCAFAYCSALTRIDIGTGVTQIGAEAFYHCNKLSAVHIEDLAAWCRIEFKSNPLTEAGALFLQGEELTELILPTAIQSISDNAFAGCTLLTRVILHDTMSSVGKNAFAGCTYLVEATVPAVAIADLPKKNLKSLTVLDGVVPENVMADCTALQTLVLSDYVSEVADGAFARCYNLHTVTLGRQLGYIGADAFVDCVRLVEVIDHTALAPVLTPGSGEHGSVAQHAITVHQDTSKLALQGDLLFLVSDNTNYLVDYVGKERVLTLPNDYKGGSYLIHDYAFYGRTALATITLSDGITAIGKNAFDGCAGLSEVRIGSGVSLICPAAFQDCTSLSLVSFATTDGWFVCESLELDTGSDLNVVDEMANARNLRSTYLNMYWKR